MESKSHCKRQHFLSQAGVGSLNSTGDRHCIGEWGRALQQHWKTINWWMSTYSNYGHSLVLELMAWPGYLFPSSNHDLSSKFTSITTSKLLSHILTEQVSVYNFHFTPMFTLPGWLSITRNRNNNLMTHTPFHWAAHLLTPGPRAASLIYQHGKSNYFLKRHRRKNSHVLHYPTEVHKDESWIPVGFQRELQISQWEGNMRVPQTKHVPKTHHPLGKHLPAWQAFKAGIFKLLCWTRTIY